MRSHMGAIGSLLALCLACVLVAPLGGCGGGKLGPALSPAPHGVDQAQSPGVGQARGFDLRQALAELDAMPTPPGADPALFARLKAGLRELLRSRGAGKAACTPPDTARSMVDDLRLAGNTDSAMFSFTYRNEGDYNQDRLVGMADLTPLVLNMGKDSSAPDWQVAQVADGNRNGKVEAGDLTSIGVNYGKRLDGYHLQYSADGASGWTQVADVPWSESALPPGGGLRVFRHTLSPAQAGFYRAVAYDSTGEGATGAVFRLAPSGVAGSAWPMFGGDPQHTHRSKYVGSQTGKLKWMFRTTGPGGSFSEPAVGPDGTVHVGCQLSTASRIEVRALNPDSSLKWAYTVVGQVHGAPALGADGTIYVGSDKLYALNPDGTLKWSYGDDAGWECAPAIDADGTLIVANTDYISAINPDGTAKWVCTLTKGASALGGGDRQPPPPPPPTGSDVTWKPSIGPDGTVYMFLGTLYAVSPGGTLKWTYAAGRDGGQAVGPDGTIYIRDTSNTFALDAIAPDGTLKWRYWTSYRAGRISNPVVGADGTIYMGTDYCNQLFAFNPDGTLKWRATYCDGSTPVIGADGKLYVGGPDLEYSNIARLYALNADGTPEWSCVISNGLKYGPALGPDGTVYAAYINGLYAVSSAGVLKWRYGAGDHVRSSPSIGADGTVYVGCEDMSLYAIHPDGTLAWKHDAMGYVQSSPAIAVDGTVYVGASSYVYVGASCHLDYELRAVNPDGSLKWAFAASLSGYSSPVIGAGGTVYFGCSDNNLYAINADGSLKWTCATGGAVYSSPALGMDGTVYVGSDDGKIYAIDPDGSKRWTYATQGDVTSSLAIGTDGAVYAGSDENRLYALNPNGSRRWSYATQGDVASSPAIGEDGTVYVGSDDHELYAINPDGSLKWTYETEGGVSSSPAIGADGTVYVGSYDCSLYAISPDGSLKWSYATGSAVESSPAIGADGTVYVGSDDGKVYAFGD